MRTALTRHYGLHGEALNEAIFAYERDDAYMEYYGPMYAENFAFSVF